MIQRAVAFGATLLGLALIVVGVALIYPPLAFIVGGIEALLIGLLAVRIDK